MGNEKLKVHWFHSKKIDGTYTLEYGAKKGKGVGPAHVAFVLKKDVLDSVLSLENKKKGVIEKNELKRLVSLAN